MAGFVEGMTSGLGINNIGLGNVTEQLGLNKFLGLISGELGYDESVRQYNTSLDWEKEKFEREIELANTAHQREMEDLKKAGLNPIMFGNKGAQTPSVGGVSPMNMNNAGQGLRDFVFSSISTALDLQRQSKENELLSQQIKNLQTEDGYMQFRQMVEEFDNMDWDMPNGERVNKAKMMISMMYNQLIQQQQNIKEHQQLIGYNEKYGDWREIMDLINKGTGSFKDVAMGLADIISMGRTPKFNTVTTKTDAWGNIKGHTYQRRY